MNNKWYICALVILLALFGGVTSYEKNITPNQEIVLQFTSKMVTTDEAQHAITTVKQQLRALGIHNTQVTEYEDGQLKITYFSNADIASIKKILSKEQRLELNDSGISNNDIPFEIPSKDNSIAYNLDVYEIQNGYDITSNLSGKLALEHKADNERLIDTNASDHVKVTDYSYLEQQVKVAYRFHKHSGIALNHISHKIPEVRAGPNKHGIFLLAKS
ncbi:hypothetical protein [Psychroserpens mesophilus]|uniref:hypothetical protein n=1 Tax=Psychroserpens mesophilus TaxID=325473 RepID=UPI003D65A6A9